MVGLQCNARTSGGTGLNVAESLPIVSDVRYDVSKIGPDNDYSTMAKTGLRNSNIRLSITFADCPGCGTECIIDERTCEQECYQIVDTCSATSNQDCDFYGGSVAQQCAVFTVAAEVEAIIRCGGNLSRRATVMDPKDIEKVIDQYRNQLFEFSPTPQQIFSFVAAVPSGQSYHNRLSDGVLFRTPASPVTRRSTIAKSRGRSTQSPMSVEGS